MNPPKESVQERINEINEKIKELTQEKETLQAQMISMKIAPFEIGGYCMAEVVSGRSKKMQKCQIECEYGILYLRPVKADGELSQRRFSCTAPSYEGILFPIDESDQEE